MAIFFMSFHDFFYLRNFLFDFENYEKKFPGTGSNIVPIEKIPYNFNLWTEKPLIVFV